MLHPPFPIISFTFDDFPHSAWSQGGAILNRYRARGTYYVALGLMEQQIEAGEGFHQGDLRQLIDSGHELGCHTHDHFHAWETTRLLFEQSIVRNMTKLQELVPGAIMKTLSYPKSCPRPGNKRAAEKHFLCCRGGSLGFRDLREETKIKQVAFNFGLRDANSLQGFFLEQAPDSATVKTLIDENRSEGGWLILATHDVSGTPSNLGCTAQFFEEIVRHASKSGAKLLPVAEAWGLCRRDS